MDDTTERKKKLYRLFGYCFLWMNKNEVWMPKNFGVKNNKEKGSQKVIWKVI